MFTKMNKDLFSMGMSYGRGGQKIDLDQQGDLWLISEDWQEFWLSVV